MLVATILKSRVFTNSRKSPSFHSSNQYLSAVLLKHCGLKHGFKHAIEISGSSKEWQNKWVSVWSSHLLIPTVRKNITAYINTRMTLAPSASIFTMLQLTEQQHGTPPSFQGNDSSTKFCDNLRANTFHNPRSHTLTSHVSRQSGACMYTLLSGC